MKFLSLDNRVLFYLILGLFIAPIWVVELPPFVDLPQHMAQVNAFRLLLQGDAMFTSIFELNWFTPYYIPHLILYALSSVLPLLVAAKLLLSISVAVTPIVVIKLLEALDEDWRLAWLSIPGAFSFSLYWGFLSFVFAIPLGLYLLVTTVRYSDAPSLRSAGVIAVLGLALFFSHLLALGFCAAVALAYLTGAHFKTPLRLIKLSLPFAVPLPLIIGWFLSARTWETLPKESDVFWDTLRAHFHFLAMAPTGIDLFIPTATFVAGALFFAFPAILGFKLTRKPSRWLAVLCVFVIFFVFPSGAMDSVFLYVRYGVFMLPVWLLIWEQPESRQLRFAWFPLLLVVTIGVVNVLRFQAFKEDVAFYEAVATEIPARTRVLSLGHEYMSGKFQGPVFLQFGAYHQALKDGISDFNFAFYFNQLVRYKREKLPPYDQDIQFRPMLVEWDGYDGDAYDYFLLYDVLDLGHVIFRGHTDDVELVKQSGRWWLYKNTAREQRLAQSEDTEATAIAVDTR